MTAVEWLVEDLIHKGIDLKHYQIIIGIAKEMEKEQIIDAFQDSRILSITNNCSSGEQYYNETFKSE
jgi:hypothetical protein